MNEDMEKFFLVVSDDQPSGSDLEYDPDFASMEKASHGTPDHEIGSTHIEAQPPDWELVLRLACGLLTRTHDLRVASSLAQAKLILEGLDGFSQGLEVVSRLAEQFWETVYPQLDADDENDPTMRINSLLSLNNAGGVIRELRNAPILINRSVGRFSLNDVAIARGEIPVPDGMDDPPTQKKLEAAVQSCDVRELGRLYEAVGNCLAQTEKIEKCFSDRLGFGQAPSFEQLNKELKSISKLHKTWLEQIRPRQSNELSLTTPTTVQSSGEIGSPQTMLSAVPSTGPFTIHCREDAIEGLDKIIRWFERYEPSSPLPMLLRRAKRLSSLSFMEILRDISPDGLNQAVVIGGSDVLEEESKPDSSKSTRDTSTSSSKPAPPPDDKY